MGRAKGEEWNQQQLRLAAHLEEPENVPEQDDVHSAQEHAERQLREPSSPDCDDGHKKDRRHRLVRQEELAIDGIQVGVGRWDADLSEVERAVV